MPTPDIFDFDTDKLAAWDEERAALLLVEQPALYVNHLRIAKSLEIWAKNLRDPGQHFHAETDPNHQYAHALEEVAAHLRQGDYVTDGPMLQDDAAGVAHRTRR